MNSQIICIAPWNNIFVISTYNSISVLLNFPFKKRAQWQQREISTFSLDRSLNKNVHSVYHTLGHTFFNEKMDKYPFGIGTIGFFIVNILANYMSMNMELLLIIILIIIKCCSIDFCRKLISLDEHHRGCVCIIIVGSCSRHSTVVTL